LVEIIGRNEILKDSSSYGEMMIGGWCDLK